MLTVAQAVVPAGAVPRGTSSILENGMFGIGTARHAVIPAGSVAVRARAHFVNGFLCFGRYAEATKKCRDDAAFQNE